jgi:hypothetical protein
MAKTRMPAGLARYHAQRYGRRAPSRTRVQTIVVRPAGGATKTHRRSHRRHSGGGLSGGSIGSGIVGKAMPYALGGAIVGYIDKQATLPIPTIPVLGKMGTVAAIAWFFGKGHPGIITEVAKAATTLAGYQLGKDGKVSGDVEGLSMQT